VRIASPEQYAGTVIELSGNNKIQLKYGKNQEDDWVDLELDASLNEGIETLV
jgi:hypothetical protein